MRPGITRTVLFALAAELALLGATGASGNDTAYPGRSGRLVFARYNPAQSDENSGVVWWDLLVSRADGRRQRKVAGSVNLDAQWSPDGTKLAFSNNCAFKYSLVCANLYVADANGRHKRRLPGPPGGSGPYADSSPTWSPDGARIAFVEITTGGEDGIFVVNADGSGRRKVIGPPLGFSLAWSPDGMKIAFKRWADPHYRQSEIWLMNADGTGQTKLIASAAPDGGRPGWSPDGKKLTFSRRSPGASGVWVVNADGTGEQRLTKNRGDGWPAWSPDGRRMAFVRRGDVYVMNVDGSRLRNVTHSRKRAETAPDWQPLR